MVGLNSIEPSAAVLAAGISAEDPKIGALALAAVGGKPAIARLALGVTLGAHERGYVWIKVVGANRDAVRRRIRIVLDAVSHDAGSACELGRARPASDGTAPTAQRCRNAIERVSTACRASVRVCKEVVSRSAFGALG